MALQRSGQLAHLLTQARQQLELIPRLIIGMGQAIDPALHFLQRQRHRVSYPYSFYKLQEASFCTQSRVRAIVIG